jgi:hypothetical protein
LLAAQVGGMVVLATSPGGPPHLRFIRRPSSLACCWLVTYRGRALLTWHVQNERRRFHALLVLCLAGRLLDASFALPAAITFLLLTAAMPSSVRLAGTLLPSAVLLPASRCRHCVSSPCLSVAVPAPRGVFARGAIAWLWFATCPAPRHLCLCSGLPGGVSAMVYLLLSALLVLLRSAIHHSCFGALVAGAWLNSISLARCCR